MILNYSELFWIQKLETLTSQTFLSPIPGDFFPGRKIQNYSDLFSIIQNYSTLEKPWEPSQGLPKGFPRASQELPKSFPKASQGLPKGFPKASQGLPE